MRPARAFPSTRWDSLASAAIRAGLLAPRRYRSMPLLKRRPTSQRREQAWMSATAASVGDHAADHADHSDHHGPVEIPEDPQYGIASPGKIAMWIFLLSDAFSFRGLLLAYGILRGGSTVWHHPGEPSLGIPFTAFLTFLLICSSVTMGMKICPAESFSPARLRTPPLGLFVSASLPPTVVTQ